MPYWRGKSILHLGVRWIMLATAVQFAFYAHPLFANPAGASVVNGAVNMQTSGNTLAITASDRSIINWQGFSIGAGETTHFIQPNASASVLNRVTSGDASQIMGALQANGQVYLINPNGVFIGNGATINVGSFLASTANVTDESFMRGGNLTFSEACGAGIINRGTITANHGDVFLLARTVENSGTIQAAQGTVGLMAGTQFFLKKDETGAVKVKVDSSSVLGVKAGTGVANSGVIEAMQAQLEAQGNVYALAINQSGIIRATGVSRDASGTIVLSAPGGMIRNTGTMLALNRDGSGGRLLISGQDVSLSDLSILTAAGTGGSEAAVGGQIEIAAVEDAIVAGRLDVTAGGSAKGGRMVVTGRRVGVFGGKLDASGGAGGGEILLGGDYQGMNPLVRNAEAMVMSSDSSIAADATVAGDGGRVILWSNEYTGFYGDISAKGGVVSGNGGFVETSSKDNLQAFGLVTASAVNGKGGEWLLDPYNVTISSSAPQNVTGSPNFTTTGSPAIIQASSINTALSAGTSVTVSTGNTSGSQDGNITVDATGVITKNGGVDSTLTLNANGSITINAAISGTSALNRLNVVLNAGSQNNGDTATLPAAGVFINTAITTIGGDITISSNGSGGTTLATLTALTTGASGRAATGTATGRSSGDVTINQTGTGSVTLLGSINTSVSSTTAASAGSAGNVTITTANGAITVGSITAVGGNGAAGVSTDTFNGGAGGVISLTTGNANLITLSGSTFNTTGGDKGTSTGGTAGAGGNVTLGSRVSLTTGSVSITTGATAGNIAFNSTLDGAQALALTSGTGNITFASAVGSTTPLGAVTLNAATTVTASAAFRAASLNQATASTGLTSFQSITTTPLTLGAGGSVTLASSLTGGPAVTVTGLIDTRGNNTGGVGQAGGSVNITTSGTMSIGSIGTSGGTALVSGAGGAGGNTVLTSSSTIAVGAINTSGGGALTSGAGGNAGAIILDTPSRNITLNGSLTTSGGNGVGAAGGLGTSLVFNDPVVLGGASTMITSGGTGLTAGASGNVYFNNTLNGSGALTITISTTPTGGVVKNGGDILFTAPVGGTTPLGTVIINNSSALGTVQVGSGSATSTSFQAASLDLTSSSLTLFATTVQTSGVAGVTFVLTSNLTPVTLSGSTSGNLTTIDTTNGGLVAAGANITVNGAVDGATANTQSLTLNSGTGGVITFGTSLLPISIGATTPLSALTITQSGGATFSGAVSAATVTITDTTDAQTVAFQGNLTATTGMTVAPNGAYNVSITGTANSIAGQTIFNNTGTVTLGGGGDTIGFTGGVVATAPLLGKNVNGVITAAGTGVINLGTTSVTVGGTTTVGGTSTGAISLGNATLANGVTLTVGTGIANAITLGSVTGTASGAVSNLTVTSTGAVILNGAIGTNIGAVSVNSNPSSLNVNSTITGSGAIILTAGAIGITTATFSVTDATISSTASSVSLTTNASGNINLNSPINTVGGTTVTLNSAGTLNIGVAGDITSDGAVSLTGTSGIQTAGNIANSADNVTFASATRLTGTVDVNTGSTGGNITFSSTLTGAGQNLNLTAGTAGNVLFSGTVGAARLGAITINSANNVTAAAITAASFVQTTGQGTTTFNGAQNYNTSTGLNVVTDTIALSAAVTTTSGGIVTLNANNLGGVAVGTLTIAAAGDIISDGAVNLTGGSGITTYGDVTTIGDLVNYNSATTLAAGVLVDTTSAGVSPEGATVTFGSTLDGGFTLGLTAGTAGNVVFTGLVGNTTPVGALTVSRAVNVEANGIRAASFTQTTGSGTTTLNSGDFTTGTDAALRVTDAPAASVANGVVTLNGLLLSTSGAGAVILNALTGGLTLGGAITSAGGATLTGANGLTQSAAISSTGVGANVAMTATTGTLSIGAGVGTAPNGTVTINAAAGALTIAAAGDINSGGAVNLTGASGISTAGDVTTTADLVNYNSATTLTGGILVNTTSGSAGGATITFLNKLDGANTLGLTAGTAGNVVFTGLVGDSTPLGALTISSGATVTANGIRAASFTQTTGSGTTTLNLGDFTTGTDQAIGTTASGGISVSNDAVVVNNRLDTAAGGIVSLTSEVGALTIASAGDITSDGAVNLTGASGISTAGDVTTTADLVNYNSATTLTGGILVNTTSGLVTGGTITFASTLGGAQTLGLTAGTTGDVVFTGVVGGVIRLGAITINSADDVTAIAISAASLVQTTGQGTTTFNGAQNYNTGTGLNVVTDTIALNQAVTTTSGGIVTLNANSAGVGVGAGTLTIIGLGDITSDGAVNLTGATGISTAGDVTTTGDVVNYLSATTLSGGVLVDTTNAGGSPAGATVTFGNTLNGAQSLGLTAGAGSVNFNNIVGAANPLGTVTVTSAAGVTAANNFSASTMTLTSVSGTASFAGNLVLTTLSVGGGVNNFSMLGAANSVTTATSFGNSGTLTIGNEASDISVFSGGLTATTPPLARFGAGFVRTAGGAVILGDVTFTAESTVDTTNNGAVAAGANLTLANALGGQNLTLVGGTGGVVTLRAATVADLTVTAGGTTGDIVLGPIVNSINATGDILLQGATAVTTIGVGGGTGNLVINGADLAAIAGGGLLTTLTIGQVAQSGTITVGDSAFKTSVSIQATSGLVQVTGNVTNPGKSVELKGGNVTLAVTKSITTTAATGIDSGNVDIISTGAGTINVAGNIITSGADDAAGGNVRVTAAANISVSGGGVNTSGGGNSTGVGRAAGSVTLNSTGGTVSLGAVTATGSAAAATPGLAGGAGGAVTVSSSGNTTLTGATINTSGGLGDGVGVQAGGTVLFNNNVVLSGSETITTGLGAGNITFSVTLNGTAAQAQDLTLTAGTGDITFSQLVGDGTALGAVVINSAQTVLASFGFTAKSLTQSAGTGSTTFNGITTTGLADAVGGDVNLTTAGNLSVSGGTVTTSGGTSTGVGRAAGSVILNSTGGTVSLGAVTATGSAAATTGLDGGAGGAVTVSSFGNTILTGATINMSGGAGVGAGVQGTGGTVLFNNNVVSPANITIIGANTLTAMANVTFAGDLTATANNMFFNGTEVRSTGGGTITLAPTTLGNGILVTGTTPSVPPANTLVLDNLDSIYTSGLLVIGSATSGVITIGGTVDLSNTGYTGFSLLSGDATATFNANSVLTLPTATDILFDLGTGDVNGVAELKQLYTASFSPNLVSEGGTLSFAVGSVSLYGSVGNLEISDSSGAAGGLVYLNEGTLNVTGSQTAAGEMLIESVNGDLNLSSQLTATKITAYAGQNFNNTFGSTAINLRGGRGLVYSTNPDDNTPNTANGGLTGFGAAYLVPTPDFDFTGVGTYTIANAPAGNANLMAYRDPIPVSQLDSVTLNQIVQTDAYLAAVPLTGASLPALPRSDVRLGFRTGGPQQRAAAVAPLGQVDKNVGTKGQSAEVTAPGRLKVSQMKRVDEKKVVGQVAGSKPMVQPLIRIGVVSLRSSGEYLPFELAEVTMGGIRISQK